MDIKALQTQYNDCLGRANRLKEEMESQLTVLINNGKVTLGVPMESRIKTWESIVEKFERKQLEHEKIEALQDLIGLRLILLFHSDLEIVEKLIKSTFEVISSEDTAKRLGETQFGYQSQHYIIRLPKDWLKVPTMAGLNDFAVEIQVRTLAQHVWASASHKLQYKHEADVPGPVRRTINRVSALLETVDLELDRVLSERKDYRKEESPKAKDTDLLNVDLLDSILREIFPPQNREIDELYAGLFEELQINSIDTVGKLKSILLKHYDAIMQAERKSLSAVRKNRDYIQTSTTPERIKSGVFFNHVGLARTGLRLEFLSAYQN